MIKKFQNNLKDLIDIKNGSLKDEDNEILASCIDDLFTSNTEKYEDKIGKDLNKIADDYIFNEDEFGNFYFELDKEEEYDYGEESFIFKKKKNSLKYLTRTDISQLLN